MVSTNGGANEDDFTLVETLTLNAASAWLDQSVNLADYVGNNIRVAFHYPATYIFTVLVDDVKISALQGVEPVTYPIAVDELDYACGTYYNNARNIAHSPAGDVFVAYEGDVDGNNAGVDIMFAHGEYNGNGYVFADPIVVSTNGNNDTGRAAIAYDYHENIVYIAWHQLDGSVYNTYVSESADKGDTWSTPVKVNTTTANHNVFPAISASDGIAYVVWNEQTTNKIFYC